MSRVFRVELGGIAPWLYVSVGNLSPIQRRYTQQADHYSLFFFEHDGVLSVNNRPIPYRAGNVGFIVPGVRFEFGEVGPGTQHTQLTFGLIKRSEVVSIAADSDLGTDEEIRRREFQASVDWLHISIMRGVACACNTLWSIAQPSSGPKKSDLVYAAEDLISARIQSRIVVGDLATELAISHGNLLRVFREEHGCTIQEFIRARRAELARDLIVTTELPLKEVALRAGMGDLQYFNKVIRAETGMSPRALREQSIHRTRH
jgi:AraC-like DNA-binding protein